MYIKTIFYYTYITNIKADFDHINIDNIKYSYFIFISLIYTIYD